MPGARTSGEDPVIICEKCGKENQDHYKFCLGCGAELPRKDSPKSVSSQTPPHGVPALGRQPNAAPFGAPATAGAPNLPVPAVPPFASPPAAAQPGIPGPAPFASPSGGAPFPGPPAMGGTVAISPAGPLPSSGKVPVVPAVGGPGANPLGLRPLPGAAAARGDAKAGGGADTIDCPQCGQRNPTNNRFCAACGYNLSAASRMPPPLPSSAAHLPVAIGPVRLVALRADGSEAGFYDLPEAPAVTLGRDTGSIFAGDSYLSPRHATFVRRSGEVLVKDEGSLNGVYAKLRPNEPHFLEYGDVFRIGQEIIRFEELKGPGASPDGVQRFGSPARGYIGRLALVIGRDTTGNAFPVPERGLHCGRERGDVLFSEDGYVSGLHCHIGKGPDGRIYLTDVGSSNGTFLRISCERKLQSGEILLMGQQLFRADF